MDPVSGERVWFHTGMPVRDLFEAHRQHLSELRDATAERIESIARLWEILEESHQKMLAERLTRGVWNVVSPELAESEPVVTTLPPPLPENSDGPVLAELEKLQKGSKGWASAMVVFGITLLLFVVAGSWQWDWRFAAMLVPILLFHELGHYVAMRLFGYQNLRIFFVPFFGAAVTGLRLNAPGWQQAIVALAGPIPGILAGWGIMVAALHGDHYWLERFGRLCVIVNGFNLLPILPLDGGRIMNSLLFARSRWLEASAVVLAAIGLAVLNSLGMGRIFLFLAFFMLLGLPRVWLIARLTALIRAKGFSPDAPSAQTISRETALAILAAIRANHLPKAALGPRTMAQMVASIYERLHTKAPGWLAVIGLLVVHGAALGAAAYLGFQAFSLHWQKPLQPDEIFEPVKTTLVRPLDSAMVSSGSGSLSSPNLPTEDGQ